MLPLLYVLADFVKINLSPHLDFRNQINNLNLTNNAKVNSYGAVSFAIIGILLIIIGVLLNVLIKIS